MANVLQVCGVTIPSVADAYVTKGFSGFGYPHDVYIEVEYRYPATSKIAWDADTYFPAFFQIGNDASLFQGSEAGPQWIGSGDDRWQSAGNDLAGSNVAVAPDAWHTFDIHYHGGTADAKIDGNTLVTNVGGLPNVAFVADTGGTTVWGNTSIPRIAGSFTIPTTQVFDYVEMFLLKNGFPGDQVTCQLQTDSGGFPSGTVLDSSTITLSGAGAARIFVFTGAVTLTAGTTYWLVLSRTGALNNTNNYSAATNTTSSGAYFTGGVWTSGNGMGDAEVFVRQFDVSLGAIFTDPVQNKLYIRAIKVGTSGFGSSDLFSEDWSGGAPLSDFDSHTGDLVVVPEPGASKFSLDASPSSLAIGIPGSSHTTVISTMLVGPPESIALSIITSLPTGVTAVFAPTSITDDGGTSMLTISADNTASPGSTTLQIQGDDGAGETETTPLTLYVSDPQPGFHIAS